jgi:inner membrane protein involved in colicin E2 resistance
MIDQDPGSTGDVTGYAVFLIGLTFAVFFISHYVHTHIHP